MAKSSKIIAIGGGAISVADPDENPYNVTVTRCRFENNIAEASVGQLQVRENGWIPRTGVYEDGCYFVSIV